MKSPSLAALEVDCFVFAVYTSIGIFLVSVPLVIYLFAIGKFRFELWGILGAADIVIIGKEVMFCQLTCHVLFVVFSDESSSPKTE
jgi:hypothetical protein